MTSTRTLFLGAALLTPAAAALYALPLSQPLFLSPHLSLATGIHPLMERSLMDWLYQPLYRRYLDDIRYRFAEDTTPRWATAADHFSMTLRARPGLAAEDIHAELQGDGKSLVLSTPTARYDVSLPLTVRDPSSLSLQHDGKMLTLRLAKEKTPAAVPIPVKASSAAREAAEAGTTTASTALAGVTNLEEREREAKIEEEMLNVKFGTSKVGGEAWTVDPPPGDAALPVSSEEPSATEAADGDAEKASGEEVHTKSVLGGGGEGSACGSA